MDNETMLLQIKTEFKRDIEARIESLRKIKEDNQHDEKTVTFVQGQIDGLRIANSIFLEAINY